MEKKESTVKISPEYRKIGMEDLDKSRRVSLKWCLTLLVLVMVVVHSVISIWCLKTEVDELTKKFEILKMKTEVEGQILEKVSMIFNFKKKPKTEVERQILEKIQNLISSELKDIENAKKSISDLFKSDSEEENSYNDLFPSDEWNSNEIDPYDSDSVDEDTDNDLDDDDDDEDEDDYGGSKKKREIRDYNESSLEKHTKPSTKNKTDEKSSLEKSGEVSSRASTEMSSVEFSSDEKIYRSFSPATKKPHYHKKHRKSRIGSAERFFTETHSTTSAPIQVRQSRTKPTSLHGINKTLWLQSQKFQQHTSPHKDTITKEEAIRKGYGRHLENLSYDLESSGERSPDGLSYNMIMIHFSADTSHYSRERDPHYFGNGRMQIKSEVYKDWKPAHWTQGVGMSKYFHLHQGRVTVSTTGIYLIYAQIQYSNVQEVNGFSVFRNKEVVVQCITTSTHPDKHEIKSNTCGISTTILLQSNDSVCIKDLHHGRYVVLTPEKSYFGLVLLSPFKN